MDNILIARDSRADPDRLPSVDITGRQRLSRKRQRPAERLDASDVVDIREHARRQFPTNDVILAARATARLSAQDKADRRGGRSQAPARTSLRRRWGAFLLQTARSGLTPAQARSVRRRSTRDELLALDNWERTMLGVRL